MTGEDSAGSGPGLIGRETELELLDARLDAALAGAGGAVSIMGDAGIGKSALAAAATDIARERGVTVAWARCWEGGRAERWWPWGQILKALGISGELLDPEGEQVEIFTGVLDRLTSLSREQPVVIVLDDLHAADLSSVSLFEFMAREAQTLPLLIIGTYREADTEIGSGHETALHAAARAGAKISLPGLDREATAEYLTRLIGFPPPVSLVESIQQGTEGNPYFIQELARQSQGPDGVHRPDLSRGFRVPKGVREIIRQKFDGLPQDTMQALTIASTIGRSFGASLVSEVSSAPLDQLLASLQPALDARVIVEVGSLGEFAFDHPMVREALYDSQPPGERIDIHRRVADALEKTQTSELTSRQLEDLAYHYFKAAPGGDIEKAITYASAAGEAAMEIGERHSAARHFLRAERLLELAGAPEAKRLQMHERFEQASASSDSEPTALRPEEPEEDVAREARPAFYRSGDFWTVRYEGAESHVKEVKGLQYLSRLLASPGDEIHAMDLAVGAAPPQAAVGGKSEGLTTGRPGDAGPLLDAQAIRAYRRRMAELDAELAEARSYNDDGRMASAQAEIDALKDEVTRSMGLSGRSRRGASPSDRARVSVTKSIRLAIERLSEPDPELGRHLDTTIRTGTYCSYQPDPRSVPDWNLTGPR